MPRSSDILNERKFGRVVSSVTKSVSIALGIKGSVLALKSLKLSCRRKKYVLSVEVAIKALAFS